jgi:hypothetical protein
MILTNIFFDFVNLVAFLILKIDLFLVYQKANNKKKKMLNDTANQTFAEATKQ